MNVKIGYLNIKDKKIQFANNEDNVYSDNKVVEHKTIANYVCLLSDCRVMLLSIKNLLELLIVKMKEKFVETLLTPLSI